MFYEDGIYPGARFLFEGIAMGGPMFPLRFYAVEKTNSNQVAVFYLEKLPEFEVKMDETVDGERWLQLDNLEPTMEKLGVEDPSELPIIGKELDGSIVQVENAHSGFELAHSSVEYGISFIDMAKRGLFPQGCELPEHSTILVVSFFKNPY